MPGFIHDKLEIKFLILYITARVIEPIPFDTVWDLAMCDEGVDYFDFAECLSDLVRTEHLTLSADGLYAITDKGLRNSRICESSLPYSVRLRWAGSETASGSPEAPAPCPPAAPRSPADCVRRSPP